jgi:photosystem II stability/assembly factor-like uncharacterized protein
VPTMIVATRVGIVIVRPTSGGSVDVHLEAKAAEAIAVDPADPRRIYVGTWGNGLWRSLDAGRTWKRSGESISHRETTAVAVAKARMSRPGVIYVGTEPSRLARSDDGGETWQMMDSLLDLPSADSWSFPPKPDTHHVRWIETDPVVAEKLYVAIEAGALVRSDDGGETWHDRVDGGPYDTHTAATHPEAEGRVYAAAGDGYFESRDGGLTWSRPVQGLGHRYLVGVAVDAGDPETVIVSAAPGPHVAYGPRNAESYVYRKSPKKGFQMVTEGLPSGDGVVASRLAAHPTEAGVLYAANNLGLFVTYDAGNRWRQVDVDWPEGVFAHGVRGLATFQE